MFQFRKKAGRGALEKTKTQQNITTTKNFKIKLEFEGIRCKGIKARLKKDQKIQTKLSQLNSLFKP
jgi:hypothetical protein